MAGKSKVLIIGGTGHIGKSIVEASAKEGHPTFALVRESTVEEDPVDEGSYNALVIKAPMEEVELTDDIDDIEPEISYHALARSRQRSPRTFRVQGRIGNQGIQVLIDGGSTHNFIREELVQHLNLQVRQSRQFNVMVGNGEALSCSGSCQKLPITMQRHNFQIDCYVLPIRGADVVLGAQWLRLLGPIVTDYMALTMKFQWQGQEVTLVGEQESREGRVQFAQFCRLSDANPFGSCYQLIPLEVDDPAATHGDTVIDLNIQRIQDEYEDVFQEPTSLPPPWMVVILAVDHMQIADQVKIIAAIKETGNVKRFFPSEFGNDVDRVHTVEPATSTFAIKAQVRRAIEAEGIPYTYVPANCFAGYFLPTLAQPGVTAPPRDKVVILGDGNSKAVFNNEADIGTFTIKAVDDPRTLNKVLFIRPPKNTYSFNELVALWEKLIGKTLERTYVPEDQLLKQIQEAPIPLNVVLAISHSIFVKGDHTNFEIEPSFGFEASELYPDVKYTTVEEYLSRFV